MMKKPVIYVVLVLFVAVAVGFALSINAKYKQTLTNIAAVPEVQEEDRKDDKEDYSTEETEKNQVQQPFIMLLFGISERMVFNDQGRADTIMLALVDPPAGHVQLISIPRDTYVEIPGYGDDKINAAYPRGNAQLLMETIENWLNIELHAFASINFQGFIDLVDLVGGIEVYVSRDMKYDDQADGTSIDLKKGEQVLGGQNALDYVRFRKSSDGRHDSDYERMERQQQALAALSDKLSSIRMVSRIYRTMDILSENVKTSLSVEELDTMVKTFYAIDMQGLETTSIQGGGHLINGAWYEVVPEDEIERIQDIITSFLSPSDDSVESRE